MDRFPLTADLCARAIVASCASFGDDPVKAVLAKQGSRRRGVPPAALAVIQATGSGIGDVERVFRLSKGSCAQARRCGGVGFERALTASLGAIGGAALVLAPVEASRTGRRQGPQPQQCSGKRDALLAPRPNLGAPVDLGVVTSEPVVTPTKRALPSPAPAALPAAATPSPTLPAARKACVADAPAPRSSSAPKVFGRLGPRERDLPERASAKITDEERALIDAAIAAGKVRQVAKDDGTELVFDPDKHAFTRLPRSRLELVPEHGWRKRASRLASSRRGAKAASPNSSPRE